MVDTSLRFPLFWNLSVLIFLLREILSPSRPGADSPTRRGLLRGYDVWVGNAIFFLIPVITTDLSDKLDVALSQRSTMVLPTLYFVSHPAGLSLYPGLMRVLEAVLLVLLK